MELVVDTLVRLSDASLEDVKVAWAMAIRHS